MCGIAVTLGARDDRLVRGMMERMTHRGPDGRGAARVGEAHLGHVRLAIVDPEGGAQPMFDETGRIAVAMNGEIYNHRALRGELEPAHAFATACDTEVLVHLYEERQEFLLPHLDGMYAFAMATPDGLLLARDPVGIKPLYYGRRGDVFLAASELKAFPRDMDEVQVLPAGHGVWAGQVPFRFALPFARGPVLDEPLPALLGGLRERIGKAVVKRLMADVPVGVFLSGGLDSSLVAAMMRPHVDRLHSFAAGMEGAPDLEAARAVADFLGTVHHEVVYTRADIDRALPEIVAALESFDAPLVRSAVPCWFVSRLAAEHVKVVLTGEGADELFAGYDYLAGLGGGEPLRAEMAGMLDRLQDTNLQRTDRMTMAHGLEGRVPFLDLEVAHFACRIPTGLIEPRPDRPAKWLLREAFRGVLPDALLDRRKLKFSEGAGSADLMAEIAAGRVSPDRFARERDLGWGLVLRSPEELFYYDLWCAATSGELNPLLVGRTRDRNAAA